MLAIFCRNTIAPTLDSMRMFNSESALHGVITLAQERRFTLADDRGVSHLFVLEGSAPVDPRVLRLLAHSGERVTVSFRDARSGVTARVAVDIRSGPDPIEGMHDETLQD